MSTQVPYSISGSLKFPPDLGEPVVDHPATGSGVFTEQTDVVRALTGSGTHAVSLGTVANGVKAFQIEVDTDAANPTTPVNIRINASSDNIQLTPGGSITYHNPNPASGGVTQISIVYTVACTVRIRALAG